MSDTTAPTTSTTTYHVEDNVTGRHASRGYVTFDAAVQVCAALNSEPAGRGGRYGVYDQDGTRRHEAAPAASTTTRTEWNTQELQEDFTVLGFQAPFVVVVRKADGVKGSLQFNHRPRVYFGFVAD